MVNRKIILVSAYGCEPLRGSEAGVGWNWILQMARYCDLHVIARANDQEKIEKDLPTKLKNHVQFYYYDCGKLVQAFKHKEKGLYLYYFLWQIGAFRVARKILREFHVDYVMHLTFGTYWMPTFLPFLNKPFIWGPLGGGDSVPPQLLRSLPIKQRLVQNSRRLLIATSSLNPLVTIPSRAATHILCRTTKNVEVIPKRYRKKAVVTLETAMEDEIAASYEARPTSRLDKSSSMRVVISGRLVPVKNVAMGIEAFAAASKDVNAGVLEIIGDGKQESDLIKLVEHLGVSDRVRFHGRCPRSSVLELLQQSDILLFPSLKEGGSWALMEGMAVGLPVICLDWTGMQVIADKECGIMIPPSSYEETLTGFTRALIDLMVNDAKRERLGINARKRVVEQLNWDEKGIFFKHLIYGRDGRIGPLA